MDGVFVALSVDAVSDASDSTAVACVAVEAVLKKCGLFVVYVASVGARWAGCYDLVVGVDVVAVVGEE